MAARAGASRAPGGRAGGCQSRYGRYGVAGTETAPRMSALALAA